MVNSNEEKQPTDPLDELEIPPDLDLLMTDYMDTWKSKYENDSSNIIPALYGISAIACFYWQNPNKLGSPNVTVPFWAIEALSEGFMKYHQAKGSGRTTTLGEAFGLEGGGQGITPILKKTFKSDRNRKIALSIAIKIDGGISVEEAVNLVADEYDLSEKTIWPIWSNNKELVQSSLKNFLTLKTSGSDESD